MKSGDTWYRKVKSYFEVSQLQWMFKSKQLQIRDKAAKIRLTPIGVLKYFIGRLCYCEWMHRKWIDKRTTNKWMNVTSWTSPWFTLWFCSWSDKTCRQFCKLLLCFKLITVYDIYNIYIKFIFVMFEPWMRLLLKELHWGQKALDLKFLHRSGEAVEIKKSAKVIKKYTMN
jgi:hypothetical protein